jgi:hypothetical protein
MTGENAKEYLINISYKLGTMGIEYLTEKDGEKMRDAIHALERESVLDKVRAEIKEWYYQADKQALAKDPCVINAMIDLFIRTIDKYKAESEDKE